ncbi:MAG: hypothetical protein ACYCYP_07655 [Leptospirales bacterium]
MDEDRTRFESLGVSHRDPSKRSRRLFWLMGGLATTLFLSGVFYTIFFYMTLPNRHTLSKPGEGGVDQVPLPVPPTSLFPRSTGSGPTVAFIRTGVFDAAISSIHTSQKGLDLVLSLHFLRGSEKGHRFSYVLSTPPRWVDGKQGASQGEMVWDRGHVFSPGETVQSPIHFSILPRTSSFDLFVSFTGLEGNTGKRYRLHFTNLKAGSAGE